MSIRHIITAGITCLFLSACATHITVSTKTNPPPSEKFSDFQRFELMPLEVASAYKDKDDSAIAKIQGYIDTDLQPLLKRWGRNADDGGRTLVIIPSVEEIKKVGGATRFFVGFLAGSSAVIMKVLYTDKETGQIVAAPLFYQRAKAFGSGFTLGVQDNLMLKRIVNKITIYTAQNYEAAVGGSTGARK